MGNEAIGIVAIVLIVLALGYVGITNSLVGAEQDVESAWAQVENQYQRRADLIPNLIETVKGYAAQEENIMLEVTKYRSQWGAAKTQDEKIAAANGMDSAISRLLLVAENYPQLKSNENFLALQSQLEGTENRIAVERMRYNEKVRSFNTKIKSIPFSWFAGAYNKKEYFEADEGADKAPKVNFSKSK